MADVNHRGRVEFDQHFVDRIPETVGQWRIGPIATGGIWIKVAADESVVTDASLKLG